MSDALVMSVPLVTEGITKFVVNYFPLSLLTQRRTCYDKMQLTIHNNAVSNSW